MPGENNKNVTQIAAFLKPEINDWLETVASNNGLTKSVLINLIVDDFMSNGRTLTVTITP